MDWLTISVPNDVAIVGILLANLLGWTIAAIWLWRRGR